jgi:hypothetical protein
MQQSLRRTAAAFAVAAAVFALSVSAGELFPYSPPPGAPVQSLTAAELSRIEDLAAKTNQLPLAQRREVRAAVTKAREDALARRDWHQVSYYTELLRRILDGQ